METQKLIAAQEFCSLHQIEFSFISSIEEAGLIELVELDKQKFIEHNQLSQLEKIIRLSHELEINLAGIEVVINLLQRMEQMQRDLNNLKNRLRFYEERPGI